MNLSFYIARRYLISKKSQNIINLISMISMAGVAIGTAALIIVLSVFNGFESLVKSLYSVFDPDIKITAAVGKTFQAQLIDKERITKIPGVISYTEVLEENALLKYNQQQYIATLKGVDSTYQKNSPLDSLLVQGNMTLQFDSLDFAVPGYGVAYFLGLAFNDPSCYISFFVPRRTGNMGANPESAFNTGMLKPSGIFSIQQEFDDKYVLVPLRWARHLLEYENELSGIEIRTAPKANVKNIKSQIAQITGKSFFVKTRFEQQEVLYKIMKSEKWAVFLILTFILLVASFNVIGSLTMLILDKQRDIKILDSMGASPSLIRRIFFFEGWSITLLGAVIGLVLGALVCYLQQRFGFVPLKGGGSFVISAYPVEMRCLDFIWVFLTVAAIGVFAAWLPAKRIARVRS